jgi:hypothetical protein
VRISLLSLKIKVDNLSVVWPQNHWDGFSRFGLKTSADGFLGLASKTRVSVSHFGPKTSSCDFLIWASKSPRRFLGLGLKTIQASVYRLHHKIYERATVWDTRRDLAACFMWKQVGLRFSSLPQNWWRRDGG